MVLAASSRLGAYGMLSGARAFKGDTAADTMTAILTKDPPELQATNREIPPALERIVRHCLEKSPDERFQSRASCRSCTWPKV